MKINNKALVKHEIRNIWPVLIYFIGCTAFMLWCMTRSLNNIYTSYLRSGYREDWKIYFGQEVQDLGGQCMLQFMIGIVLLVYLQFKDNKSLQVSGFIKSLPYTNQEVYKVKLCSGLLTITVPFAVLSIGAVGVRSSMYTFLTYIERISLIGSEINVLNSLGYMMRYLLVLYGILIFGYLFAFWMQYLVNNNVASLVISGLSLGAIPFIIASYGLYVQCMLETNRSFGQLHETLVKTVCPLMYLNTYDKHYQIYNVTASDFSSLWLRGHVLMGLKLMILVLLIVMLLMAIHRCNKNYKAENQEGFISATWAEKVFKIGAVISCMGLVIVVIDQVSGIYDVGQKVVLHIVMIGVGVIAYLIVNKICGIGKR